MNKRLKTASCTALVSLGVLFAAIAANAADVTVYWKGQNGTSIAEAGNWSTNWTAGTVSVGKRKGLAIIMR